ncbi:MAG: DUF507 family protein [Acidobacteria bacterium]|nr:DUF507 family protein [Acidobacteriota bacterium]
MRLPNELITIICRGILRQLIERKVISTESTKETILKLEKIFKIDLEKDNFYTESAKKILESKYDEIKSQGTIDYRALLTKVKKEIASKDKYVLWSGESKFPEDKVWQLSRDFVEFFKSDDQIEYFVKPDQLVKEVVFAFKNEVKKDQKREEMALKKVLSIKRNIKEGTSEFETLKDVFYREFLSKEA